MEIREGIKYEYELGKFATVKQSLSNPKQFYAIFEDARSASGDYSVSAWVKDFESGSLKLIEYPYKVGDWVFDINSRYISIREPVLQILEISNNQIWCNDDRFFGKSRQSVEEFNTCYRPAFKHEIPTNTNQVIVENMDYLIPFIDKLNEKRI